MSSHPSPISALKLRVTQGLNVFEDPVSSSTLGPNNLQITSQTFPVIFNAFNSQPLGTIFTPSIVATYATGNLATDYVLSIPIVPANFIARVISLASIPNKETTDTSFSLSSLITTISAGVLSYSSTNTSVATVNSLGVVTLVGAGTTTITVSQAATANHPAGTASATFTVTPPRAWVQRGQDINGEAAFDNSGYSVSLSADGTIVAIGAINNNINGSFSGEISGHVRVYVWNGIAWVQRGQDINGEARSDFSGTSVSLSADGTIVAIGALYNDGNGSNSGHVRVYAWNGTAWVQRGQDIDGEAANDQSGTSVSLSADGTILAIGATGNDGNGSNSGHVRVYVWNGTAWVQRGQDINGEAASDNSGISVSLSADGTIVAIGATRNDGNSSLDIGHVRVYVWNGIAWVQRGQDIDGEAAWDESGISVSLSADGTIVAIGATGNDDNGSNSGHVRVYVWNGTAWVQRGQDIDGEAASDNSGISVSLSADGTILAIGATFNDGNGSNSGHVRVWAWNGTAWVQRGQDIDGEAVSDQSGRSVSLSANGTIVAIGATGNDDNGSSSGHVRVFKYQ